MNPVIIPSSTNSSSSQAKQSSQQIGTIGNKTSYNVSTPQPSPVNIFFICSCFICFCLNIVLAF